MRGIFHPITRPKGELFFSLNISPQNSRLLPAREYMRTKVLYPQRKMPSTTPRRQNTAARSSSPGPSRFSEGHIRRTASGRDTVTASKVAKEKKNRPRLLPVSQHFMLCYSTPKHTALSETFGCKLGWGCPVALRSGLVIINQQTTTRTGKGKGKSLVQMGGPTSRSGIYFSALLPLRNARFGADWWGF